MITSCFRPFALNRYSIIQNTIYGRYIAFSWFEATIYRSHVFSPICATKNSGYNWIGKISVDSISNIGIALMEQFLYESIKVTFITNIKIKTRKLCNSKRFLHIIILKLHLKRL